VFAVLLFGGVALRLPLRDEDRRVGDPLPQRGFLNEGPSAPQCAVLPTSPTMHQRSRMQTVCIDGSLGSAICALHHERISSTIGGAFDGKPGKSVPFNSPTPDCLFSTSFIPGSAELFHLVYYIRQSEKVAILSARGRRNATLPAKFNFVPYWQNNFITLDLNALLAH